MKIFYYIITHEGKPTIIIAKMFVTNSVKSIIYSIHNNINMCKILNNQNVNMTKTISVRQIYPCLLKINQRRGDIFSTIKNITEI